VVIVPLLGITYLITLVGPREPDSLASLLFIHTRSVLISFQVENGTLTLILISLSQVAIA
jgi:hypothetical protein